MYLKHFKLVEKPFEYLIPTLGISGIPLRAKALKPNAIILFGKKAGICTSQALLVRGKQLS
jgi:hypothetical protein